MFSQTVDYALRAMVFLAMNPGNRTNEEISQVAKVPGPYLAKIMKELVDAGLLISHRGVHGGFALARPGAQITVFEIVSAVEPLKRIDYCPLGIASHGKTLCSMHYKMDQALEVMENTLKNSTLEDLLTNPTPSIPLCPSKSCD